MARQARNLQNTEHLNALLANKHVTYTELLPQRCRIVASHLLSIHRHNKHRWVELFPRQYKIEYKCDVSIKSAEECGQGIRVQGKRRVGCIARDPVTDQIIFAKKLRGSECRFDELIEIQPCVSESAPDICSIIHEVLAARSYVVLNLLPGSSSDTESTCSVSLSDDFFAADALGQNYTGRIPFPKSMLYVSSASASSDGSSSSSSTSRLSNSTTSSGSSADGASACEDGGEAASSDGGSSSSSSSPLVEPTIWPHESSSTSDDGSSSSHSVDGAEDDRRAHGMRLGLVHLELLRPNDANDQEFFKELHEEMAGEDVHYIDEQGSVHSDDAELTCESSSTSDDGSSSSSSTSRRSDESSSCSCSKSDDFFDQVDGAQGGTSSSLTSHLSDSTSDDES